MPIRSGRELRVVAIGGGTGLSTLLKGLKKYVVSAGDPQLSAESDFARISELCAVVTVTDDGGSSGRLRKEFNMLPPGDVRNCIVALSEDEALLSKVFQHRFDKGTGLEGHSFGNLFLAALTSLTGDFSEAVRLSSEILADTRTYLSRDRSEYRTRSLDGRWITGPGRNQNHRQQRARGELFLVPPGPEPLPQTLEAIACADLITVGPGSLFTSLIPNLLVAGFPMRFVNRRHQGLHLQSDDPGE